MKRVAAAAVMAFLTVSAACAPGPRPEPRLPDVVFVLVDTLRADRLGSYGNPGGLSPAIDQIASEGALFEQVVAPAPWTQPSVASLFSSFYPEVHGVLDYGGAYRALYDGQEKIAVFDGAFTTLPEQFAEAGYATAAFVANPFILEEFGFAQGFEHFDSSFALNTTPGSTVNEAALAWLAQRDPDRPVFLFLHYMDVHGPYDAPPEILGPLLDEVEAQPGKLRLTDAQQKSLGYLARLPAIYHDLARHERLGVYREYWAARYDAGVRQADRHIGELAGRLDELGLWEESLVVVTSDHGEALMEHGHWDHGYSLHGPELNVPWIVRLPASIPAGERLSGAAGLLDVMPTLLDLLGLPIPDGIQGRALLGESGPVDEPRAIFASGIKHGDDQRAVQRGGLKLIQTPATGEYAVYQIEGDPGEGTDLAASRPEEVAGLLRLLSEQSEIDRALSAGVSGEQREVPEELLERLRSLGYVD